MIDESGRYLSFDLTMIVAYERPTLEQLVNAVSLRDAANECAVVRFTNGTTIALRLDSPKREEAVRDLYDSRLRAVRATIDDLRKQLDEAEERLFGEAGK